MEYETQVFKLRTFKLRTSIYKLHNVTHSNAAQIEQEAQHSAAAGYSQRQLIGASLSIRRD